MGNAAGSPITPLSLFISAEMGSFVEVANLEPLPTAKVSMWEQEFVRLYICPQERFSLFIGFALFAQFAIDGTHIIAETTA